MHSASEDLVAFKRACGVVPAPLFDTQIAAALAGIGGGMGYQRLVQERLGVALAKGETRSDWLRRPLSPAQLEYAADDVLHLDALYRDLAAQLDTLQRRAWLDEDAARLLAQAADDDGERWPHLSMRSAQFLDAAAQRRLLRLLRWRDAYARESDRPRNWILDNEFAVTLARAPTLDRAGLQQQLDSVPKAPRALGDALWQALQHAACGRGRRAARARRGPRQGGPAQAAGRRIRTQRRTRPARRHPRLASLAGSPARRPRLARRPRRLAPRRAGTAPGAAAGLARLATVTGRPYNRARSCFVFRGAVAQLGERHVRNVEVVSSILIRSTTNSRRSRRAGPVPAFSCGA